MNGFKNSIVLIAGITGVGAGVARATVVDLTIQKTGASTFSVFEQNANNSDTVGLDGLQFDVLGGGGVNVTSITIAAVKGTDDELGPTGFNFFKSSGTVSGSNITGASIFQNAGSYSVNSLGDVTNVFTGVGNVAETIRTGYNNGDTVDGTTGTYTQKNVSLPALIATGTFTGGTSPNGTLTVQSAPNEIALLPSAANYPSAGPGQTSASYATHSPDAVLGQTIATTAVPEPASFGLLGIAGAAIIARRRKA